MILKAFNEDSIHLSRSLALVQIEYEEPKDSRGVQSWPGAHKKDKKKIRKGH